MKLPISSETVDAVWKQAKKVNGLNPDIWRKDFAGAWIRHDFIGIKNDYGWSIEYKRPPREGGNIVADNLMPMHWRNKEYRDGKYPEFVSLLTSSGEENVEEIKSWRFQN